MAVLVVAACGTAAVAGFCLATAVRQGLDARMRKQSAKATMSGPNADAGLGGALRGETPALRMVRRASVTAHPAWMRALALGRLWGIGLGDARGLLMRAGLADSVTPEGMRVARVQGTGAGCLAGMAMGTLFSVELSAVLGVAGAIGGFALIPAEIRRRAASRTAGMERHLSEMVEVVVLGLRSGLSFERSFRLYPKYFDTELGQSMERVARMWEMGLVQRDEALRSLEGEYDSALLSRVTGSMVRSLRFGTSIADSLESVAVEAREVHRARMEERVAKVAVKMMLPVGTLILPAMLLLVLGPVLLELVQGF